MKLRLGFDFLNNLCFFFSLSVLDLEIFHQHFWVCRHTAAKYIRVRGHRRWWRRLPKCGPSFHREGLNFHLSARSCVSFASIHSWKRLLLAWSSSLSIHYHCKSALQLTSIKGSPTPEGEFCIWAISKFPRLVWFFLIYSFSAFMQLLGFILWVDPGWSHVEHPMVWLEFFLSPLWLVGFLQEFFIFIEMCCSTVSRLWIENKNFQVVTVRMFAIKNITRWKLLSLNEDRSEIIW